MLTSQTEDSATAPAAPRDCENYCKFKLEELEAAKTFTDIPDLQELCEAACGLAGPKANAWETFKVVKSVLRANSSVDDDWGHHGGCHGKGMHGPGMMWGMMGWGHGPHGHGGPEGRHHGHGGGCGCGCGHKGEGRNHDKGENDEEKEEGEGEGEEAAVELQGEVFGAAVEEDLIAPEPDFADALADAYCEDAGAAFL
eukprot:tig00021073_g18039.t1